MLLHVTGTPGRRSGYIARPPVPSPLFPSSYNNIYPTTYLTFVVLPRDIESILAIYLHFFLSSYNNYNNYNALPLALLAL